MPIVDAVSGISIPAALRELASLQPSDAAFTFIDYDRDPDRGVRTTRTWLEMYRRARCVATALREHGPEGERAVILAPQGLDYIAAFLGCLEAGIVAVPVSVPRAGSHDERVSMVIADSAPAAILTTSAVSRRVAAHLREDSGMSPVLIEVDTLDVEGRPGFTSRGGDSGIALLQYTSGSTRRPAGVMVSHRNLIANNDQIVRCYFADTGNVAPRDTTIVSWLPFYHDMGLFIGICAPILSGIHSVLTSPLSFLVEPARWLHMMASNTKAFSPAPNFALELAIRNVTDAELAGIDLGGVTHIVSGAERVHAATLERFTERFAPFGLKPHAFRPSYGLAEATVYVAARAPGELPKVVRFDSERLTAGHAEQRSDSSGTALVSYGVPVAPFVRIVDGTTRTEIPEGAVGEIWVHGENVAQGYWRQPAKTRETFSWQLVDPSPGTPVGPWLRTGDLGFMSDGELFIAGRIKDLVIIRGQNYFPDDIEATVAEFSDGRVAAIPILDGQVEALALILEYEAPDDSPKAIARKVDTVKSAVTSAVTNNHLLAVADIVLVRPGSIPMTSSGKVRRSECAQLYRDEAFKRVG